MNLLEKINFINQLNTVFPSQVKNCTNLDFPYTLQEARMENKFLVADFYSPDEDV